MKQMVFPRWAVIALGVLFLSGCNEDGGSYFYNEPTIYSETNPNLFSEVVFFLRPYLYEEGRKVYAVADRLENVRLTINEKLEKRSDSYPLDAVHVADREVCGEYWATEQVIHYPVVVGVSMVPESLTTAGEYADLLNDYLHLQPGAYVCRIVSFDIQTAGGERRTIYTPALSVPLEVEENKASVFLGEFEVEIK